MTYILSSMSFPGIVIVQSYILAWQCLYTIHRGARVHEHVANIHAYLMDHNFESLRGHISKFSRIYHKVSYYTLSQ